MSNTRFSKGELAAILAITLCVTVLAALALRAYLDRDNRWDQIASPANEKAVEIVAVTRLLQPYVRTEQGNVYRCNGNTWRDTCEIVESLPWPLIPPRWETCVPDIPALPPLSGEVVHSLDFAHCEEARTYARLVILDDGTIWRWQRTFSWVNGFAFASGLAATALLAFGAAVGLVYLRRYLNTPIPEAPKTHEPPRRV